MKKGSLLLAVFFTINIFLVACQNKEGENTGKAVTVILDYVPNTNHTGMYVALKKGYYEDEGLSVSFIEPGNEQTSATLVAAGKGQFGISYQEDVTYALSAETKLPIQAVATIMAHNTSGFVSVSDAKIQTPKDFEGKIYAGWQSPSEEAVIQAVMKNNQADFNKLELVGDTGGGFSNLGKDVDIKWFFEGWDLVKADMAGVQLNYMPLRNLDSRLDYYTPLIITSNQLIEADPELITSFLRATKKGYQEAIKNPGEAAAILHEYMPDYDLEFLEKSQEFASEHYTQDMVEWGKMEDSIWNGYTNFMYENGLISREITAKEQYTNRFLGE